MTDELRKQEIWAAWAAVWLFVFALVSFSASPPQMD